MSQTVWFHINTYIKMYIINCSIFLTAVLLSPYSVHYQTLCAKRTMKTLQFTIIPQVLAVYIHYQFIYSTKIYSPELLAWYIQYLQRPPTVWNVPNCLISYQYVYQNVYLHPRARRAHRNCPTYIHPPIVGMIYPIPTYIVRRQILPKLLAAYIQYKSYNSKTYITQLCARRAQRNLSIYCESSNSVRQLSQSVCIGMTLSFGWLGSKRSNRVRHSNRVWHAYRPEGP